MTDTEEHARPRYRNGNGALSRVVNEAIKYILIGALAYIGSLLTFTSRLTELERVNREWQYYQCNGVLSEKARAAITFCRDIPDNPTLRRFLRDTT